MKGKERRREIAREMERDREGAIILVARPLGRPLCSDMFSKNERPFTRPKKIF